MNPALWFVDAFSDQPFAGNPAAVYLLEGQADPGWMQALEVAFASRTSTVAGGRRAPSKHRRQRAARLLRAFP